MRLSPLQKYILKACYGIPPKIIKRGIFVHFYDEQKLRPKAGDLVNIITKSLECLINKGLLTGYGVRTPQKWYIKEVKLTVVGRRTTRRLLGEQQKLPLKVSKSCH
ncbi:MAG: hypothetical protein AAB657_04345 [Patescibacteria group bacterium]